MGYTLAAAAHAAKVTKLTIFLWIKEGRISGARAEDGTYRIDPEELHRYLDSVSQEASSPTVPSDEADALSCEVEELKALLETEWHRLEEARQHIETWKGASSPLEHKSCHRWEPHGGADEPAR
jgi:hypothetical protein